MEHREQRLEQARASVRENDRDPNAYIAAARCCKQLGQLDEALDILRTGLDRCDPSPSLYEYYVERRRMNRTEEQLRARATLFSDTSSFACARRSSCRSHDSQEQVVYYAIGSPGLHRLISEVRWTRC